MGPRTVVEFEGAQVFLENCSSQLQMVCLNQTRDGRYSTGLGGINKIAVSEFTYYFKIEVRDCECDSLALSYWL